MSREAMEAVQEHSQFDTPEHYYQFRVLLAIASFADMNGRAGVVGKAKQCPSQRALAERAKIHRNTFTAYLDDVLESGEVEIIGSGGAGRGAWTAYQINLPMPKGGVPISEKRYTASQEADTDSRVPIMEKLVQIEQLLVQINGTFGTRPLLNGVQDTNRYHKDTPPNPPKGANGRDVDFARRFDPDTTAVLEHMTDNFGITVPEKHQINVWGEWLADLDKLLGIGGGPQATCDLLDRVRAYMDEKGLSYSRPASFVKIARRMASEPESRYSQEAHDAWSEAIENARNIGTSNYARWPDLTENDKRALRAIGGKEALREYPDKSRETFLAAWDGHNG